MGGHGQMTKGPASEGVLGDLHSKVAKVMTNALTQIETAQALYDVRAEEAKDDPEVEVPPVTEVNPALLSVMVRFLDANKITCAPATTNVMGSLEAQLAAKRQKRVGNVVQLREENE